jgi:hypothetical protein
VVFGWLSRRCERQADLDGVAAVATGRTLADGVVAMTRVLEKTAILNDGTRRTPTDTLTDRVRGSVQGWLHGSFEARAAFLQRLPYEPALPAQTHRAARRFQTAMLAMLALALIAVAAALGTAGLLALL